MLAVGRSDRIPRNQRRPGRRTRARPTSGLTTRPVPAARLDSRDKVVVIAVTAGHFAAAADCRVAREPAGPTAREPAAENRR